MLSNSKIYEKDTVNLWKYEIRNNGKAQIKVRRQEKLIVAFWQSHESCTRLNHTERVVSTAMRRIIITSTADQWNTLEGDVCVLENFTETKLWGRLKQSAFIAWALNSRGVGGDATPSNRQRTVFRDRKGEDSEAPQLVPE